MAGDTAPSPLRDLTQNAEYAAGRDQNFINWPVRESLPGIVTHDDFLRGLVGFKQNLTAALPFVPPEPSDPAHPGSLWARLQELRGDRGLLLTAPGGSGKTRTCVEVAERATAAGWRVLHVMPGEPATTTEQVAAAVLGDSSPVLVVIDYLSECGGLDLPTIGTRLLPETARRGIDVALLASARPGWLARESESSLNGLFERVRLISSAEQQSAITAIIAATVAPTAVSLLGAQTVAAECGLRPIIALLVARELEARAVTGHLDVDRRGLRQGYLLSWLQRRLQEDGLVVPAPESLFEAAEPPAAVLACAAIAGASSQNRMAVLAAARAAAPGADANRVLEVLLEIGWFEQVDDEVMPVHDVVADQLLEGALLDAGTGGVHAAGARAVFDSALTQARTLGRFALSTSRLLRDLELQRRAGPLSDFIRSWLASTSPQIGRLLADSPSSEGSYALGSVLDAPIWGPATVSLWDSMVGLWQERYGTTLDARHAYSKGLRSADPGDLGRLQDPAMDWLELHHLAPESRVLLRPLLGRRDVDPAVRSRAANYALAWLAEHGTELMAQQVLAVLLTNPALDDITRRRTTSIAVDWLGEHWGQSSFRHLLAPLLSCPGLDPEVQALVAVLALKWLGQHARTISDGPTLDALLSGPADADWSATAVPLAMEWLTLFVRDHRAGLVLSSLLARADLSRDVSTLGVQQAMDWLDLFGTVMTAGFVLRPLLFRTDLDLGTTVKAARRALDWLGLNGLEVEAQFVLRALLERSDLPPAAVERSVELADAWLERFGGHPDACFVLRPLLEQLSPEGFAETRVKMANSWLIAHAGTEDISFLAKYLARRRLLDEQAYRVAVAWCHANVRSAEARYLLGGLTQWLEHYPGNWEEILAATNDVLAVQDPEGRVNESGEVDQTVANIVFKFGHGVWGARADDLLASWIHRPEALSGGYRNLQRSALVSRVLSLIYGGRVSRESAWTILERIERWVLGWNSSTDERALSLGWIEHCRQWLLTV